MLYTRQGDKGTSGLFGTKERFPKDSPLYEALGTLDELNSLLGLCAAVAKRDHTDAATYVSSSLQSVQQHLFTIQAEIAGAEKHITPEGVAKLEGEIAELEARIVTPNTFVLSGATELSSILDFARAVARRAERSVFAVRETRSVSEATYAYLNRLSSLLYALARYAALETGTKEEAPKYER